jgi:AcrR family transcriptional regulator
MVAPQGTRDQIIDAAEHLFGSRGYAGVSISQICAASGLPVGSVYHHFGSKAGVMRAVLERGTIAFFADLPTADSVTGSPAERVAAYYGAAAELVVKRLSLFRLFASLKLHDSDEAQAIVNESHDMVRVRIAEFIEPVARSCGVADPAACAREVAQLTVVYTTGVTVFAGEAGFETRAAMGSDLPRLVMMSILDRAGEHVPGS